MLQVNPNTVLRSYDFLQQKGIIYMKRGMGYFTVEDALEKVIAYKREEFFKDVLPKFFRTISLLKISTDELNEKFKNYKLD